MTDQQIWMNIEQAAVTLGLSVRTVNRHINAGKLQSRLAEGRREVLMDGPCGGGGAMPQPPAGQTPVNIGAAEAGFGAEPADAMTWAPMSSSDNGIDPETVLALADNAADKAELAVTAYQALARTADERVHSSRRLLNAAWVLVGFMSLGAFVSLGWTTNKLTRAAVEHEHLQKQVTTVTAQADNAEHECDDLRIALAAAREDAARAEGRLAAYSEPRQTTLAAKSDTNGKASPSTRPSTFADRIASIFEQ
jgi:outer membrane murein-binding lipoprotein Lpp